MKAFRDKAVIYLSDICPVCKNNNIFKLTKDIVIYKCLNCGEPLTIKKKKVSYGKAFNKKTKINIK